VNYVWCPRNSYNGQIERGQREVGEELDTFPAAVPIVSPEGKRRLGLVGERLSRRSRPCLGGRAAEEVFYTGRGRLAGYTQDRRIAALEQVEQMSADIIEREGIRTKRGVAAVWRRAVETWLLQEGIIAIEKGESVTPFPSILVS